MRTILLSVILSVMFCSCIREDMSRCPAFRNILFTHYSLFDPDRSFDNRIANDVLLCTYKDGKLKSMDHIPYDRIKGGRMYSARKRYGGNLHFAAWSVPSGSQNRIPQCGYGEDFYGKFLEMQAEAAYYKPIDDIYLGTEAVVGDDVNVETTHTIRMINAVCRILVTVEDPAGEMDVPAGEPYILLEGVMSKMDMSHKGAGENAEVYAALADKKDEYYSTGYFGVLPSAQTQNVGVRLYCGGECLATVITGEKALSGGHITIHIVLGRSVYVEINGWEITPYEVRWM